MRVRGREPIEGIDWDELSQQKIALLRMLWDDPDHKVWGIIHLIDAIQDYYEPDESYHSIVGKIPMNRGEEE
tara:strand:- start:577 stop:792 length:216 start_codon:yes stop_codon:yes gene_type:complete